MTRRPSDHFTCTFSAVAAIVGGVSVVLGLAVTPVAVLITLAVVATRLQRPGRRYLTADR